MEKLKLPVFNKSLPLSKSLSMDEYFEFVQMNLKYTFNKKEYEKQKKLSGVHVAFTL